MKNSVQVVIPFARPLATVGRCYQLWCAERHPFTGRRCGQGEGHAGPHFSCRNRRKDFWEGSFGNFLPLLELKEPCVHA